MDILNAYHAVKAAVDSDLKDKESHLPVMRHGAYAIGSETFTEPNAVWARLVALAPRQGWLLFQSRQMAFVDGLPERDPAWGVLLAAEGYTEQDGATVSLALDQDGRGGWALTTYTHEGQGDDLYDEPEQLAHNPSKTGPGTLRYRRYWQLDPDQGYTQAAACFIGFSEENV